MKTFTVRCDLLETRGLSPLAKLVFTYLCIQYYFEATRFVVYFEPLAKKFGTTEKRVKNALLQLYDKNFITVYGSFDNRYVKVVVNEKRVNEKYPKLVKKLEL